MARARPYAMWNWFPACRSPQRRPHPPLPPPPPLSRAKRRRKVGGSGSALPLCWQPRLFLRARDDCTLRVSLLEDHQERPAKEEEEQEEEKGLGATRTMEKFAAGLSFQRVWKRRQGVEEGMVVEVAVPGPGGAAAVQAEGTPRVETATMVVRVAPVGAEARALAQAWMAAVAVVRTKR